MRTGVARPELATRREDGRDLPLLVWRFDEPVTMIVSGPLGGGLGRRRWIINATVASSYSRMDPEAHLAALADGLGRSWGPGPSRRSRPTPWS